MPARSFADVDRLHAARLLLGVPADADRAHLARAFRAAIKAARPDHAGGDAERFRQLIAAYRLIQQADVVSRPSIAVAVPDFAPVVSITAQDALNGGQADLVVEGVAITFSIPRAARTGDVIDVALRPAQPPLACPILIRPAAGLTALGDDLFMTWPVCITLLRDGGRLAIDTHAGQQSAWVTPGLLAPVRLRLKNLGLPARADRPQGHLFVTLVPMSDRQSETEARLAQFTALWTSERLAA